MKRDTGYKTAEKLMRLAIRMTGENGITIPEIMEEFSVSRATAFRMKKSVERSLVGRVEFEVEQPEDEEDVRRTWGAKKQTGVGRDWTYKIYEPSTPLIFNDVGLETLRALEVAEQRLRAENLTEAAVELSLLAQQVNDRLDLRSGTGIAAETLLEASGIATRVSPRVQAPQATLRAIQSAIVARTPIRFRYYLRRERKYRTYRADPLGVIFHRFSYLACINHKARRGGVRTFRLSEVDRIEELPGQFKPPNFDLDDFTQQSFGVYQGGEPLEVIWRFKPNVAEEAEKFVFHPAQTTEREKDGSLIVKFIAKGAVEMVWELFTWGNDVEIVAPHSLKETYISLVEGLAENAENHFS